MTLQPLDTTRIRIDRGKYLSDDVLAVGDTVLTVRGVGVITGVFQRNYLPRFQVRVIHQCPGNKPTVTRFDIGKTKIKGKFVPTSP